MYGMAASWVSYCELFSWWPRASKSKKRCQCTDPTPRTMAWHSADSVFPVFLLKRVDFQLAIVIIWRSSLISKSASFKTVWSCLLDCWYSAAAKTPHWCSRTSRRLFRVVLGTLCSHPIPHPWNFWSSHSWSYHPCTVRPTSCRSCRSFVLVGQHEDRDLQQQQDGTRCSVEFDGDEPNKFFAPPKILGWFL